MFNPFQNNKPGIEYGAQRIPNDRKKRRHQKRC